MVGAPRPPAAQIRELHSRTSWFGHGPQTHTKTGRWNQVLIMATAWLAQRSQHEPAPRISCSIEPGGARARIGSCADPLMHAQKNHSPRVVDPSVGPCRTLLACKFTMLPGCPRPFARCVRHDCRRRSVNFTISHLGSFQEPVQARFAGILGHYDRVHQSTRDLGARRV